MPNYEGLSVEDAIQKGLKELNLSKKQVKIDILEEGKKGFLGFGKKEALVSIVPLEVGKEEPVKSKKIDDNEKKADASVALNEEVRINDAKEIAPEIETARLSDKQAETELARYLTEITKGLRAPALVRVTHEKSNQMVFNLDSEKPGMLIGKHGRVLNALQYLSQVFVHRIAENRLSVVVNVGDYRERRELTLKRMAKNTEDKVRRTGQAVFLEPMPAFERKMIHAILAENNKVMTHSEGDEPFRYLVVEPKKNVL